MHFHQNLDKSLQEKFAGWAEHKTTAHTAAKIIESISEKAGRGEFPIISTLGNTNKVKQINDFAAKIRKFQNVIILGTGGSSLTGQALVNIRKPPPSSSISFLDNIDPQSFSDNISDLDMHKTFIIVISKSGRTLETIAQFLTITDLAENRDNFLVITDPGNNPLREIADKLGIECADHEPDIGGRFSIFTNVALLPAAIAGMDISLIQNGAKKSVDDFLKNKQDSLPAKGALLHLMLGREGFSINAIMPYMDRLSQFATWYRQLWAESTGKSGHGTTPIKAMGTIDQHSQLQLYMDGPKDKFFTFISASNKGKGHKFNSIESEEFAYLSGKTMGDVMEAELTATRKCLSDNGCPVRHIQLKDTDEEHIGALAMHFMLETILFCGLLEINPFDQPAVERVKSQARKNLGE